MLKVIRKEEHEFIMMHYMILTRQMASLSDSLLHIIRLDTRIQDPDKHKIAREAYSNYAQTELGDITCQVMHLCEVLGLDFGETVKMGETRYKEKMEEFQKKYPSDHWV